MCALLFADGGDEAVDAHTCIDVAHRDIILPESAFAQVESSVRPHRTANAFRDRKISTRALRICRWCKNHRTVRFSTRRVSATVARSEIDPVEGTDFPKASRAIDQGR